MPWSGGAFTRAGGSTHWVDDKNASINIVSSRHDTNDEDIASGINNCVTKDGQSKMTADFTPNADLGAKLGTASFRWSQLNGFITYSSNNNVTQAAPTSGAAYDVTAATDAYGIQIHGFNSAGHSRGLLVGAGVGSASDIIATFQNQAGTTTYFLLTGDGLIKRTDNAAAPALFEVGYLGAPQNSQNANYGFLLSDQGKSIVHTGAGANTWTIPANASVAFPINTTILLLNVGAGTVTLNITTDTLIWLPSGATGSRSLPTNSMATLYKYSNTQWVISGTGVT